MHTANWIISSSPLLCHLLLGSTTSTAFVLDRRQRLHRPIQDDSILVQKAHRRTSADDNEKLHHHGLHIDQVSPTSSSSSSTPSNIVKKTQSGLLSGVLAATTMLALLAVSWTPSMSLAALPPLPPSTTTTTIATTESIELSKGAFVIQTASEKTPLAKELGKIWYTRLPDNECDAARKYTADLSPFWQVLREAWDEVLIGDRPFIEKKSQGGSRYSKILYLEDNYAGKNLSDPAIRLKAKNEILEVIGEYRAD